MAPKTKIATTPPIAAVRFDRRKPRCVEPAVVRPAMRSVGAAHKASEEAAFGNVRSASAGVDIGLVSLSTALDADATAASPVGHCGLVEEGVEMTTGAATLAMGPGKAVAGWDVGRWKTSGAASDDAGRAIPFVS
jgi:hypothetical protein